MLTYQIERGFLMYETGSRVDMGMFSRDVVGTIAGEYAYTASLLSKRRWNRIMGLCGAHSNEQQPSLKVHATQMNRRTLYAPSSPMKGSDNE
jgi:NADH pyrophosphatase NudC (nudix superfamily)